MSLKRAFDPVVDAHTRLLILGSLPGDASLKAGQYYGHPQNGFWRLIGGVIGLDLVALPYPDRLEALNPRGVLARGYAILVDGDGRALRCAAETAPGATLTGLLHDGELSLRVQRVTPATAASADRGSAQGELL